MAVSETMVVFTLRKGFGEDEWVHRWERGGQHHAIRSVCKQVAINFGDNSNKANLIREARASLLNILASCEKRAIEEDIYLENTFCGLMTQKDGEQLCDEHGIGSHSDVIEAIDRMMGAI